MNEFSACVVLGCDAKFFHQAVSAVESIDRYLPQIKGARVSFGFVAIHLLEEHRAWLRSKAVAIFEDLGSVAHYPNAPIHAYAQTCRPFIPQMFPGFDAYLWVDCDIRFARAEGVAFWLNTLTNTRAVLSACQEVEPSYSVSRLPGSARAWYGERVQRLEKVWGKELVDYCGYFPPFNSGLFGARADSPIWQRYRYHVELALPHGYDHMREQDAFNVALLEVGGPDLSRIIRAPATMNWLAPLSMPLRASDGTYRDPNAPERIISVLHLAASGAPLTLNGKPATYYDAYRAHGMPV